MRTITHQIVLNATLTLNLPVGEVQVHSDRSRSDVRITLEPIDPADTVAADLISRATVDTSGDHIGVTVPHPPHHTGTHHHHTGRGVNVVQSFGTVVGTVVGVVMVNGHALVTGGTITGVGSPGAVRLVAYVPSSTDLAVTTASADLNVTGSLPVVEFRTASGDLTADSVANLTAKTASGQVSATTGRAVVDTMSGDVRLYNDGAARIHTMSGDVRLLGGTGHQSSVSTMSGDVEITAQVDNAIVDVTTMSGDITVVIDGAREIRPMLSTVSGRVRTHRIR